MANVERATAAHCRALVPRIPAEDNADMLRGWGTSSEAALMGAFTVCDDNWAILDGAEVLGMFGCHDGNLWLIRGEDFDRVAIQFIRQATAYIDRWLEQHGLLHCFFSKRYGKLLRWIKWAGFTVTDLDNGYVRCEKCAGQ